jgi:antitoxin component YwqK of YwqJK toxin-antitoxin module
MKNIFNIFLFMLAALIGMAQEKTTLEDGSSFEMRLVDKKNDIYEYKGHYKDGKLQSIGQLKGLGDNIVSSDKIGEWMFYHENGELKSTGNYKDGYQVGEWKFYHVNGSLKEIGKYKDYLPLTEGKYPPIKGEKVGEWKTYFDDGKLEILGNYQHDKMVGEWKRYYNNGKLRDVVHYTEGKPSGLWKNYSESGELLSSKNYDE